MVMLVFSLIISTVIVVGRLVVVVVRRLARRSTRRHAQRAAVPVVYWWTPPPPAAPVRAVAELERCVDWLIWALSRETHPGSVAIAFRATDPNWWATIARVRAHITQVSCYSPEPELAAWAMAVLDGTEQGVRS
jgi:hypothetical protein